MIIDSYDLDKRDIAMRKSTRKQMNFFCSFQHVVVLLTFMQFFPSKSDMSRRCLSSLKKEIRLKVDRALVFAKIFFSQDKSMMWLINPSFFFFAKTKPREKFDSQIVNFTISHVNFLISKTDIADSKNQTDYSKFPVK